MEETLFTKIINGEIPSHRIYEDEYVYAFLDIAPANLGHTLVVPKLPVEFVWDLPNREYLALMQAVKQIAQHLRAATGAKYVGQSVVGTDVPHAHVHLVPFDTTEQFYNLTRDNDRPSDEALAAVADRLRMV